MTEQLEFNFFGITPLKYYSNQEEHKQWIDRINANPGNCNKCGRLQPKDVLPHLNGMCSECFWHFRAVEQNFKPTIDYDYDKSIAEQKEKCPEMFQQVC